MTDTPGTPSVTLPFTLLFIISEPDPHAISNSHLLQLLANAITRNAALHLYSI